MSPGIRLRRGLAPSRPQLSESRAAKRQHQMSFGNLTWPRTLYGPGNNPVFSLKCLIWPPGGSTLVLFQCYPNDFFLSSFFPNSGQNILENSLWCVCGSSSPKKMFGMGFLSFFLFLRVALRGVLVVFSQIRPNDIDMWVHWKADLSQRETFYEIFLHWKNLVTTKTDRM